LARQIWILSEPFFPDEGATAYVLTQLAEAQANHRVVKVLCAQPASRGNGERRKAYFNLPGVSILRCAGTTFNSNRVLLRALNGFSLSLAIFFTAWKNIRRGDIVLAVTNPPVLPWFAAVVCRLNGASGILLIHDLYPDVLAAVGLLGPDAFLTGVLEQINRWTYRQYTRIVVLGRDMQARVAQALDAGDERVVCIPNWSRVDVIRPLPRPDNQLLQQLGLSRKFVIQYSGNMGRTHGLKDLLDAALLLGSVEDVRFLFIGSGSRRDWLAQAIVDRHAANVTLFQHSLGRS